MKDINPGTGASTPVNVTPIGNVVYFAASVPGQGYELWTSDGTEAGTVLVKDINPGPGDSGPNYMTLVGGIVLFNAGDAAHGRELWRSDGTDAGTYLLKDLVPGGANSSPLGLTKVGDYLFFATIENLPNNLVNTSLWMTDGTAEGTVKVMDAPGPYTGYTFTSLAAAGNTLYFRGPTQVDPSTALAIDFELFAMTVPERPRP